MEQVVVFRLAGEIYALDIEIVREIIRLQDVVAIPEAPDHIAGVISLRDRVIPIVELRRRFGLPRGEEDQSARIVIIDLDGSPVGIKVDAVLEVLRLDGDQIGPVPAMAANSGNAAFLRGIANWQERLILLLAGHNLLAADRDSLAGLTQAVA